MSNNDMDYPKRGEVWLALFPDEDLERPCVIVSIDSRNQNANSVMVVPLTTNLRSAPTHIEIFPGEGGLSQTSMARCENLTTLRKRDFGDAALGRPLSELRMKEIEKAILRAVGVTLP